MTCCPACKRPLTTIPIDTLDELDAIPKPRKEQLALDALIMAFPAILKTSDLYQALYDDVGDKEPESRTAVMAHLSKLRKKLLRVGWNIRGHRFMGYQLVKEIK